MPAPPAIPTDHIRQVAEGVAWAALRGALSQPEPSTDQPRVERLVIGDDYG